MQYLSYVIVALSAIFIFLFNALAMKKNMVKNALATIDLWLKKRIEIIPQLAEVLPDQAELLMNFHSVLKQSASLPDKIKADAALTPVLNQVLRQLDNTELGNALMEIEDRLAAGRASYNALARQFNQAIHSAPGTWYAKLSHTAEFELFAE